MTYSKQIELLRRRLVATGVRVDLFAKLPKYVIGRCSYGPKLIQVDAVTAEDALITLAHEAAHWFDYLWNPHLYRRDRFRKRKKAREVTAYLLGWKILRQMNSSITKKQWQDSHEILLKGPFFNI